MENSPLTPTYQYVNKSVHRVASKSMKFAYDSNWLYFVIEKITKEGYSFIFDDGSTTIKDAMGNIVAYAKNENIHHSNCLAIKKFFKMNLKNDLEKELNLLNVSFEDLFSLLEHIRVTYGYDIWVMPDWPFDKKIYQYNIENLDNDVTKAFYHIGEYETPYDAYINAIKFTVNNLL
jgi:hypothetical protein